MKNMWHDREVRGRIRERTRRRLTILLLLHLLENLLLILLKWWSYWRTWSWNHCCWTDRISVSLSANSLISSPPKLKDGTVRLDGGTLTEDPTSDSDIGWSTRLCLGTGEDRPSHSACSSSSSSSSAAAAQLLVQRPSTLTNPMRQKEWSL